MPTMSEPALKRTVTVANRAGLHCAAAVMMVTEARKFDARVVIAKGRTRWRRPTCCKSCRWGPPRASSCRWRAPATRPQAAVERRRTALPAEVRRGLSNRSHAETTRNSRFAGHRHRRSAGHGHRGISHPPAVRGARRRGRRTGAAGKGDRGGGGRDRRPPRRPSPRNWARSTPPSSTPTCKCSRMPGSAANWRT